MLLKIFIALVVLISAFLIYVATRPSFFRYERSGVINATPEEIFPYISQLKLGHEWSPYEKTDPNMKKNITGVDGEAGAAMDFEGNKEAGSGRLEILKVVPNQAVDIKLIMIKPFHAENLVQYSLSADPSGGTRFTWVMSGDGGFLGKLISVLIDCEKMIGGQFEEGIANLKTLIEGKKGS